jgi:quercetin dioxygenase-like cupin family protein
MELHKASEIRGIDEAFKVISHGKETQVAMMTILPDNDSGEYGNDHPQSDQVLLVLEGRGHALIEGKTHEIEEGDVLHIQAGEKHQIKADGANALRTINVYAPKAYSDDEREEQQNIPRESTLPGS